MIRLYRKKPVVVQAQLWDGTATGATPIINWIAANGHAATYRCGGGECDHNPDSHHISIRTLEGDMRVSAGDYVIRGVQGEFYPCKPDIFDATYEPEALPDGVHPESRCARCKGPNIPWSAPSPLWNRVIRGGDINGEEIYAGIVCPTCFAVLAQEQGVAELWLFSAERVHVPLQTTTPSGRIWNESTWQFDEPQVSDQHTPGLVSRPNVID